jgi:hypothetical protein
MATCPHCGGILPTYPSQQQYISVCAGCDKLFESARRDQLTCSNACRVRAHRSGELKRLRQIAAQWEVRTDAMMQIRALTLLRPDLEIEMRAGRLTLDQAMPEVVTAFNKLAWQAATAALAQTRG